MVIGGVVVVIVAIVVKTVDGLIGGGVGFVNHVTGVNSLIKLICLFDAAVASILL